MKNRTFAAHLYRLFCSPPLYICIVSYVLLLIVPMLRPNYLNDSVMSSLLRAQTSAFYFVLSAVIPALAYAVTYVDDYDTRMLYPWAVRSGAKPYAVSYYLTALLGGFLVGFLGNAIYIGIHLLLGMKLDADIGWNHTATYSQYDAIYDEGQIALYVFIILLEYALGAAAMAGISAMCSSLFHQRFATLAIPVFYFFMTEVYAKLAYVFGWINLHKLLIPGYLAQTSFYVKDPSLNILYKLLTVALHIIVCGYITVRHIERSVDNA